MKIEWVGSKLPFGYKCLAKKALKATLVELEQSKRISICINIISPEEMQDLNKRTRGIDKVTDVLSFPSATISAFEKVQDVEEYENHGGGLFFIGDMAICMEEVQRQAIEYQETPRKVFARLVIHSVLHLLGFDHIEDSDHAVMEPIQNKILNTVIKK